MFDTLGPHTLFFVDPSGLEGEITVKIESGPAKSTDLGEGAFLEEVTGTAHIESSWIDQSLTLSGLNDLQLVFRLLWMADIYLQEAAKEQGYRLYKYLPGDVDREFGIYN